MKNEALDSGEKKYLFNTNIFDENYSGEDTAPPPPVFTQEQLDAAKQKAFQEGKKTGIRETEGSLTGLIAETVKRISQDMNGLIDAEKAREEAYEREVIALTLQIFQKLFPVYNEKYGFEEFKNTLTGVLKSQEGQKKIKISLPADIAPNIQTLFSETQSTGEAQTLVINGDPALASGAFALSWEDGGAVRDADALARQIEALMQGMLSAKDKEEALEGPASGETG